MQTIAELYSMVSSIEYSEEDAAWSQGKREEESAAGKVSAMCRDDPWGALFQEE